MMNFNKMKTKKHFRTFVCMIAGVMLLSTAVYANYDNASGYSSYKNAVKNLVLSEENYTASGDVTALIDGKEQASMSVEGKRNGKEYNVVQKSQVWTNGEALPLTSDISYSDGKTITSFNEADNSYYQYADNNTELFDPQDKTVQKAINFAELLTDTFVGDLKNNFVLVSDNDGIREYSVNVSGSQMPEVINAGLSLMFTGLKSDTDNLGGYVTFQDYGKAFGAFYLEKTGKELSDDDINSASDEEYDAYAAIQDEFYNKYDSILQEKNSDKGIVYVKEDGSYVFYNSYDEYSKAVASEVGLSDYDVVGMLGEDPYIDYVKCNFTLDKEGRILTNSIEGSLAGVDASGKTHSITLKANLKMSDYGVTVPEKFDPTGKTKSDSRYDSEISVDVSDEDEYVAQ